MRSKQYFTSIKNNPHEISTDPKYPFAPMFELIECYAKGDKNSFSKW